MTHHKHKLVLCALLACLCQEELDTSSCLAQQSAISTREGPTQFNPVAQKSMPGSFAFARHTYQAKARAALRT